MRLKTAFAVLLFSSILATSGCENSGDAPAGDGHAKAGDAGKVVSTIPTPVAFGAPPKGAKCPSGADSAAVSGQCKGKWRFEKGTCQYVWQEITCQNQGYNADAQKACYGITTKPFEGTGDEAKCESKFANPPQAFGYLLHCCK